MFIDLLQTARAFPLVPTGSLLQTNSLLGHELIAGPMVGDKQIVGHKEPGPGAYAESIDSVRLRYRITNVIPPVSNEHGWATWLRMVQQFGQQWFIVDNCQHAARRAYYGVDESPTLQKIGWVAGGLGLLWLARRD